jgi:Fur family transcriptional regulator, ferric uptake regulator
MSVLPAASNSAHTGDTDAQTIRIIEPLCAVFRRKLRSVGLKYTPERAAILDAIIRRDQVFEAEKLMQDMRASKLRVSKATVYRTIKLLAEAGIIQQVLFDSEQAHYQLAYGVRSSGLLVNVDTREITPIELPELAAIRDRVCKERGLSPEGHRFVVYARGERRATE